MNYENKKGILVLFVAGVFFAIGLFTSNIIISKINKDIAFLDKNALQGDGYYWLDTPERNFVFKVGESIDIPVTIFTPNKEQLKLLRDSNLKSYRKTRKDFHLGVTKKEMDEFAQKVFDEFIISSKEKKYTATEITAYPKEISLVEISSQVVDDKTKVFSIIGKEPGTFALQLRIDRAKSPVTQYCELEITFFITVVD